MNRNECSRQREAGGFTLVELLVVIGMIALLISMLLPSLGRARQAARAVKCGSDVRQMLLGYAQYHLDNRGCLLLGYPPHVVNGWTVSAEMPGTGTITGLSARRYPWRLVPYVGDMWPVLHGYESVPEDPYSLGVAPAIGINAVYFGGYDSPFYRGYIGDQPNAGKHIAFRAGEVRQSSRKIIFSESQSANDGGFGADEKRGLHFVTPPRAGGQRWTVQQETFILTSGALTGLPKGRFGKRTVVGFFDGHVESLLPPELEDMRLWAPRADRSDYDFVS